MSRARKADVKGRKPESCLELSRRFSALAGEHLLLLLLCAVPLAFTPHTHDRYTQVKWAILQLGIPFLIAAASLAVWPEWRRLLKGPVVVPAIVFVACAFLSVFFAENKPWAARAATNLLYMLALMMATKTLVQRGMSLRKILITVTLISTLVAFLGIVQYFGMFGQRQIADSYGELHTPSTIGHNNFAAAYIVMAMPAAVALLVGGGNMLLLALSGICIIIQLYYLLITASRGGWAGFAASLAFWFVWAVFLPSLRRGSSKSSSWNWSRRTAIVAIPLVLIVIALVIASPSTRQLVSEKAASLFNLDDQPIRFRILTWRSTLSMIAEHPLGVGMANYEMLYPEYRTVEEHRMTGRFKKVQRAHNEYLQTTAELGAQGLVAFMFLIVAIYWAGFRASSRAMDRKDRLGIQAVIVGQTAMLVHSFFSFPLQLPVSSMMFWVFCGIIAARSSASRASSGFYRQQTGNAPKPKMAGIVIGVAAIIAIIQVNNSEFIANYHQSEGLSLKNQGRFEAAAKEFERASEFCGSDFLNHYLASVCLRNLGRLDEAIEESIISLDCNPRDHHSLFNLGALYSYKGRTAEAIELWKKVLSVDPDYAQAYFNMGAVYAQQGKDGLALSAFENAIRIDPSLRQAWHNMVVILESMGRLTEARDRLVKGMESVQDLQLSIDLARVYASLGEIGNAQRTLIDAKKQFGEEDRINELMRNLPK
ncbi:MAG: tetratricopeptide repeat protein [Candidatus Coatesbacteria bacterium]|nr:tetratricopeptide repeat protein [Candidatus Coatesbacteria bacterium]